jgi:hypothetical protein
MSGMKISKPPAWRPNATAVQAAIFASDQVERSRKGVIAAVERELESARYEASPAGRRYELVDPQKRYVARELEALE